MGNQRWPRDAVVTLAVVSVLVPVTYTIWFLPSDWSQILQSTYTQALVSSWAATVLGVGAGIPFALWLNQMAQNAANESEDVRAKDSASRVEARCLKIAIQDLEENLKTAAALQRGEPNGQWQTARWNALVAAGHVSAIDDLDTLAAIAQAFERIDQLSELERQFISALTSNQPQRRESLQQLAIALGSDTQIYVKTATELARRELSNNHTESAP